MLHPCRGCDHRMAVSFSLPGKSHGGWCYFQSGHGVEWVIHFYGLSPGNQLLCLSTIPIIIGPAPGSKQPLNAHQWSQDLQSHPDIQFQSCIVEGITSGFQIGFDRSHSLHSATKNLHSSNPAVILEYLEQEVCLNRTWKLINAHQGFMTSQRKLGKWKDPPAWTAAREHQDESKWT